MSRIIIVSDLHVDTWDETPYGEGDCRKPKLQHWCDFLDWCEAKEIEELVINGDLMDAPPYEGNVSFTSPIARAAVERLLAYAPRRRMTYIYGNHDIGISGLRCGRDASLSVFRNVNLVYPDYVLPTPGSTILLQHGHLFDPVLLLYMRDLGARTYDADHFDAFQWGQQRRDPRTGERTQPPGVESPAQINLGPQVGNNVYRAIKAAEVSAASEKGSLQRWADSLKGWIQKRLRRSITHRVWREAARGVCEQYLGSHQDQLPVIYSVMGHTHVPDSYEWTIRGKRCLYFNIGTWTGAGPRPEDRQYATYLDVDPAGKVWIQDWIRDPWD